MWITRGAKSIPKKEFYRLFKPAGERLTDCIWEVFIQHQSAATSVDFLDYATLASKYAKKRPIPSEDRFGLAYELFDLGGQQSVSKDDMIRVCKAIHKSSFVPDFDRSESEKFIEIFWKSTPNKILNQEEFVMTVSKHTPEIRDQIGSAFGLVQALCAYALPDSTSRLVTTDPQLRRTMLVSGVVGSKKFVIDKRSFLTEFKRDTSSEPTKTIPLNEFEIDRPAHTTAIQVTPIDPKNKVHIRLDMHNVYEAHDWLDRLICHKKTPLHHAIMCRDFELFKQLLETPASNDWLQCRDVSGLTPLHLALKQVSDGVINKGSGDVDVFILGLLTKTKALSAALIRGMASNSKLDGWTGNSSNTAALKKSVKSRALNADMTTIKKQRGGGINVPDVNGWAPLHTAAATACQSPNVLKLMLSTPGIRVDERNDSQSTPMHYYCSHSDHPSNCVEIIRLFHSKGADINAANQTGETPLHRAVLNTAVRSLMMKALLDLGADIDAQTKLVNGRGGDTPLHYAAHLARTDLVEILLNAGASVSIKNGAGQTPYDIAHGYAHKPTSVLLKEARRLYKYLSDERLDMAHLVPRFLAQHIYLNALPDLNDRMLQQLNVKKVVERKKLLKAMPYLAEQLKARQKKQQKSSSDTITEQTIQVNKPTNKLLEKVSAEEIMPSVNAQTTPEADLDGTARLRSELAATAQQSGSSMTEFASNQLEFLRELGTGTSGTVFSGLVKRNPSSPNAEPCAIKILKAATNSRELVEFQREFSILAAVRNPFLVEFYGVQLQPSLCLVMELCSRGSLYDVLKRKRLPIGWQHVLNWAYQAAIGIGALHRRESPIVHRDLKSLNLLMTENYDIRVCDFGLSRHSTQSNMETLGKLRGTMAYCAPEAYLGETFTPAADIYSFGIILWEMAVRIIKQKYERPFSEYPHLVMDFQIIIQVAKANLRPTTPETTPRGLKELIASCLDKTPSSRPNVTQLASQLKTLQKHRDEHAEAWDEAIVGKMDDSDTESDSDSDSDTDSDSDDSTTSSSYDSSESDDDDDENVPRAPR